MRSSVNGAVSPRVDTIAAATYCDAVTDLLSTLAAAPGVYRGRGDGAESGPFIARIAVAPVVRGRAVTIDYEATNESGGLRHVEHTVLATGEGGRLELYVACLDLPGVVRFVEGEPGVFSVYDGPFPARIVASAQQPGAFTYAWWWSRNESGLTEQHRAEVRRSA
jgi:hypothetical protein